MKKYIVELTRDERRNLRELINRGKAAAYRIKHANILLKADQAKGGPTWTDERIVEAFGCHVTTVANVRKQFVTSGLDVDVGRPRKFDGDAEAKMTMIACSEPPANRSPRRQSSPRDRRMRISPQPKRTNHQLAIHHHQSRHKTKITLPRTIIVTE